MKFNFVWWLQFQEAFKKKVDFDLVGGGMEDCISLHLRGTAFNSVLLTPRRCSDHPSLPAPSPFLITDAPRPYLLLLLPCSRVSFHMEIGQRGVG